MNDMNCVTRAGADAAHTAGWGGWIVLALGLTLLTACSGSGEGPSQGAAAPTAIATPIGYKPTSAAGANPVIITVRSGADVQLTGEDSFDGNAGISGFAWQQTDSAPTPAVTLIYRSASTVSFTAPAVASDTTLNFQLTVTNRLGASTAKVQVSVIPANDPNLFLSLPGIPRHFRVALSLTNASAAPGTPLALPADVPVCVALSAQIEYQNRIKSISSFALPGEQVETK